MLAGGELLHHWAGRNSNQQANNRHNAAALTTHTPPNSTQMVGQHTFDATAIQPCQRQAAQQHHLGRRMPTKDNGATPTIATA